MCLWENQGEGNITMEPVKADIIEYIGDYGEKYSLNISEMISTEMIEK